MAVSGPIYFWRETETEFGFLSQWYASKFHDDNGKEFGTAEQWMMYQKSILFGDEETAAKIMSTTNPKKQRVFGREVANFVSQKWDLEKVRIVEEGSYHKFMHPVAGGGGEHLKEMLLATGERKLYEASPYDRIWGIGFKATDAEGRKAEWGENLLGNALETTRQKIREEEQVGTSH